MATNFPASLDTVSSLPAEVANIKLSINHVIAHQNIQDALEAVEAKMGVDSSAVTTTHDYKLGEVTVADKAVGKTASQVLTNKTLTSPVINVGSDATGDIYYRNAGILTRLAIGANSTILKIAAGIPSWAAETVITNASTTVNGTSEEATQAETTAGTATGGTGARLFVSPASLAGSTPVFNGSALTSSVGSIYKNGSTSKTLTDSSASQTIAHGCGRIPINVRFVFHSDSTSATPTNGHGSGFYNGTNNVSVASYYLESGAFQAVSLDTTNAIVLHGGNANSNNQSGVVTYDATNITITWTKNGTPNGTGSVIWEAVA